MLKEEAKEKYKFGYMILHYLALSSTLSCIDSVKKRMQEDDQIIVIDNASPDNSGIQLENKFIEDSNVKGIINKTNLGFAKGNNIGFMELKKYIKLILLFY